MHHCRAILTVAALSALAGCDDESPTSHDHGPVAPNIAGALGEPVPYATPEQLEDFEAGREVAERRFMLSDGLGPAFNVTFCGACHEKPTTGGSAGLYRNFFLGGVRTEDGAFFPSESAGMAGGVIRLYAHSEELPQHPDIPEETNVIAQRNPIPFFGVGLIAELPESVILENADPDDADGDGISGRPNYDRGFVGRFGRKSQTVSLEGFIRGPLFNHLGISTDPLSEAQKAELPVDSSGGAGKSALRWLAGSLSKSAQAAAPAAPLTDDDGVTDPEMSTDDLFDLVSFTMLLAAPEVRTELDEGERKGRAHFNDLGCGGCHVPRLEGPRGPLPVYSDLLLHDMGPELADGLVQGEATGREFRTQPLWGLSPVGPYLHDGRASTIEDAILMHGGEAQAARDRFAALDADGRYHLLAFLATLGGADQASDGLLPPDAEAPEVGQYGGPFRALSEAERDRFEAGQALFDREFGFDEGLGAPRFNGDSCRACHFEPVIGGAGPRGVNVIRHGIRNDDGAFAVPATGTVLHRLTAILRDGANRPQEGVNVFELRQTPPLFGLGLIASIPESAILARADPDDEKTPDGISGKPSWTDGGRLGRFGWKADVPTLREFVRDALTTEMGMSLAYQEGQTFGDIHDTDEVPDPELEARPIELLTTYLQLLGPPPRQPIDDPQTVDAGEQAFSDLGCANCHTPSLPGKNGAVHLYSDVLLHEVRPEGEAGIESASANVREFRTPPLWGVSQTAPYLHDGSADTLDEAILAHAGEATAVRESYVAADATTREQLLAFLKSL